MSTIDSALADVDVAVVHGNYFQRGGGEVVAEELARAFDAPLYYGFGDREAIPTESDVEFRSLFGDRRAAALSGSTLLRDAYYLWAFQHVEELHEYDLLVQSGNEMGWYVPPDDQVLLKYVHSTPRTTYDRFPVEGGSAITRLCAFANRVLYRPNLAYPDVYLVNSELIARRCERYWDIDPDRIEVLYPPVDTDSYTSDAPREDFYFTFSRFSPAKRIDEIIGAFAEHPEKRLVVGGSGPDRERLEELAGPNVEFRGYLSEQEKRDLLSRARALCFAARNEDFGIVPIEAFASGCPVIGVREGYTQHQIEEGITGLVYDRGVGNLSWAIWRFDRDGVSASPTEIAARAKRYDIDRFRDRIREVAARAYEDSRIASRIAPVDTTPSEPADGEPTGRERVDRPSAEQIFGETELNADEPAARLTLPDGGDDGEE
jgi:glycosyltransferase involved in cell wall biosynthesis